MSLPHLHSGEVFNLGPLGEKLKNTPSTALFKTNNIEVMRLVIQQGKSIPEHAVSGELTLHCLEGKVELQAHQKNVILSAGDLAYLDPMQPYSLVAKADSSVLVTMLLHEGSASPLEVPGSQAPHS